MPAFASHNLAYYLLPLPMPAIYPAFLSTILPILNRQGMLAGRTVDGWDIKILTFLAKRHEGGSFEL